MIQGQKVLAVIPARGGSKGLPDKNILPLAGKPLLAWTLDAAGQSRYLDRTIVSTDDDTIANVAQQHGADIPFMRPASLAADTSPTLDAIFHALDHLPGYDLIILLQPTSPLRCAADIDGVIELLLSEKGDSCVSVAETGKSPHWMFERTEQQRLQPIIPQGEIATRRQDLPIVYVLNGAVYAARVDWLRVHRTFLHADTLAYVMPKERSLDIDDALDFHMAEILLDQCNIDGRG